MQTRCPHCDKAIQPGAILCPHCGSYVVKMEERKKRWHLFAIPLVMAFVLVGFLLYVDWKEEQALEARRQAVMAERKVDPSVQRQHDQDEAERRRMAARKKQIEEEKRRRREARERDEEWRKTPRRDKIDYLSRQLVSLRQRIASLKESAASDSTEEFRMWLMKLESKIGAADTFIEAEQFNQARALIEGAQDQLDEMLGTVEEPPAEEEQPDQADSENPAPAAP